LREKLFGAGARLPDIRAGAVRLGVCGAQWWKMVAIGRALMARPTLVLLDEPSMGLAPIIVQEIF